MVIGDIYIFYPVVGGQRFFFYVCISSRFFKDANTYQQAETIQFTHIVIIYSMSLVDNADSYCTFYIVTDKGVGFEHIVMTMPAYQTSS